ncbi:MAG: phosphoribosylanthranilate isomerase [Opitutae bacterium]|nr:phosphoribosylanthranilate isomerase [Opitutae bacterium]
MPLPFIKICGITRRPDARFCAEAGAGALGAVFYEKSPRYVSPAQARYLFEDVPAQIARVGVFVDASPGAMIATARAAALDTVQMHGEEPMESIRAVMDAGFHVVKVLDRLGDDLLAAARALPPQVGLLVECGKGVLPGGNAAIWNWSAAAALAQLRPFAIAGGLHPLNLAVAARASRASGYDVSSGVESAPGVKDEAAVRAFLRAARDLPSEHPFSWKGSP